MPAFSSITQAARRQLSPSTLLRSKAYSTGVPHGVSRPHDYNEARAEGTAFMEAEGWDVKSLHEQPIVWGDLDSFAHVNNARYITFFETGRMAFVRSLLPELPQGSEKWLVQGKPGGAGVILGHISARYKRAVVYPDHLLVAHRPTAVLKDRFLLEHICWSFMERRVVTTGECSMVMFDYGLNKKTDMPREMEVALKKRMGKLC